MRWRLIIDGGARGAWNMAVDEAILLSHARGDTPPTLRLYEWRPPAVSVGYFQDMAGQIDLEACVRLGVEWVRRPTGGRAVLHEDEVTYSVTASERILGGSVLETYLELSKGLVEGLRLLGAQAEVAPGGPSGDARSAACFDAPSWYEIVCGGRKVVGSAQTRHSGVMLQHGSIPLRFDVSRAVAVLQVGSDRARQRLAASLGRKAAGLEEVLGRRVGALEVKRALAEGYSRALGWSFEIGGLTPAEREEAARLEKEKYGSPTWNELRRGRDRSA
ncbi:MAG: lipoate--protein ligase family protein [Firmicutes bacterium]|jgi:lipoate-protein ligase A|nr:lipoate--protein ligase family protein [Bacillota bacterium]